MGFATRYLLMKVSFFIKVSFNKLFYEHIYSKRHQLIFMKTSFSKIITKKWKSHLEVWVAKRHLHRWLLAKPYIYIYIYIYIYRHTHTRRGVEVSIAVTTSDIPIFTILSVELGLMNIKEFLFCCSLLLLHPSLYLNTYLTLFLSLNVNIFSNY